MKCFENFNMASWISKMNNLDENSLIFPLSIFILSLEIHLVEIDYEGCNLTLKTIEEVLDSIK
jgi:hypothetical protein